MKVAVHLAHPAHYHLFKPLVELLGARGHRVLVTYNEKDVLHRLMQRQPIGDDVVDLRTGRPSNGTLGLLRQFARKEFSLLKTIRHHGADVLVGTSVVVAHTGTLLGIPSIIVNEDDFDVIAGTARIGYPFCSRILSPACCRSGRWGHKVTTYEGYHELAYLAPPSFKADRSRIGRLGADGKPFFILRFAGLSAHHDVGRSGITRQVASALIEKLAPHGRIHITSERPLEREFEAYRISLDPMDIHHALSFAALYVGDSQTMAAEAAVLGTPSIRFNDFVGRISYLEELEHRYGLTVGIPTSDPRRLCEKIDEILRMPDVRSEWRKRRARMLAERVDPIPLMARLVEERALTRSEPRPRFRPTFSFETGASRVE